MDDQVPLKRGVHPAPLWRGGPAIAGRVATGRVAGRVATGRVATGRVTTGNVTTFDATAGMAVGIVVASAGTSAIAAIIRSSASILWRAGALGDRPEGAPARGSWPILPAATSAAGQRRHYNAIATTPPSRRNRFVDRQLGLEHDAFVPIARVPGSGHRSPRSAAGDVGQVPCPAIGDDAYCPTLNLCCVIPSPATADAMDAERPVLVRPIGDFPPRACLVRPF